MLFRYFFLVITCLIVKGSTKYSWSYCKRYDGITDCSELHLTFVPRDIFYTPDQKIKFSRKNEYRCDCDISWFLRKLRLKDYTQTIIDLEYMTCAKPADLKGEKVYLLDEMDVCPEEVKPVDECRLQLDECHKFADCLDKAVGYDCLCNPGFTGDGKYCTDIDECKMKHDCPTNGQCMNTLGTYTCVCKKGYREINQGCQDVDECEDGTAICHRDALCENTPGSYRCTCKPGYHGHDGRDCVPQAVKSCSSNPSPCRGLMEECIDGFERGEYECRCRAGFARTVHGVCKDINECKTKIDPCNPLAECKNTKGSYKCVCPTGYFNQGHTCNDIDECANGEDSCHRDAICVNNIGSYSCVCRAGFTQFKDGRLCLKEEEEDEFDMTPVIVGLCILLVLAVSMFALIVYVREVRKRKKAIDKKPLVKGKSKRNWFSNLMFPEADIDRIGVNESALTIWSDSD